jgi:CRP/FNR family transcriptional regulator
MHPLFRADCSDAVDASGRRSSPPRGPRSTPARSSPPRGLRSIAAHPKSRRDQHARLRDLLEDALPAAAPATIQRLADGAAVGRLAPREPVCRQGEAVRLTLVLAGYVGHWHTTPDGRQMVLAIVRPGGLTGHTAIARQSAIADTLAITPAEVAVWSGEDVRRLVAADPGLALDVVDVMARYILQFANRLDRFVHQDARRRVLRVLAAYADLFLGEPPVLSRTLLPAMVGTSREMTGRVLRALEAEGVIARVGRRGLRLLRPSVLEDVAERANDEPADRVS